MGINSILGLSESFSANKFCQSCDVSNSVLNFLTEEDVDLLKTPEAYDEDLQNKTPNFIIN